MLQACKFSTFEQGNGAGPDHFVLNHLPFAEDLRVAKFTSFEEKTDLLPTEQQVGCMSDLVRSMDLHPGGISLPMHFPPVPGLRRLSGGCEIPSLWNLPIPDMSCNLQVVILMFSLALWCGSSCASILQFSVGLTVTS